MSRYDLTVLAESRHRANVATQYVFAAVAIVCVGIGGYALYFLATGLAPIDRTLPLILVVGVFSSGLCLLTCLRFRFPATSAELSSQGLTLEYRSGKVQVFPWGDHRFRLSIQEWWVPDGLPAPRPWRYELQLRVGPMSPLTAELFGALKSEAEQRGLKIRETRRGVPEKLMIVNYTITSGRG